MHEADGRYLDEIAQDCRGALGRDASLIKVYRVIDAHGVRLVVLFKLDRRVWESTAVGETIVDAHARLRRQLIEDRLRIGSTELVTPR